MNEYCILAGGLRMIIGMALESLGNIRRMELVFESS